MTKGRLILITLLIWAVVASALAVVHAKFSSRQLFVELQELQQQRDAVNVEWGRLQLEFGTWGTHGRIEREAHSQLGMRLPQADEVVVVRGAYGD
jgi:cell division protein FtsL